MRLLITGGAGFIGSATARIAIAEGHDVLVVDKLTYAGNLSSLKEVETSPRFRFAQVDICDETGIAAAVEGFQPDAILHLAAESHVDRSITGAGVFIETNIIGTFRMLQAARAYWEKLPADRKSSFRFLHVSTDEVYGSLGDDGFFREDTPYDPRSPYSASKASSDHLASAWHHTYGLPMLISNCSNNYGPYHLPEKLIPLVILNALEGKPLPVYGTGANVRDWLYVDDHARGIASALLKGKPGEKYNFGGRAERRNLDVVHAICDALDEAVPTPTPHRDLITFVADRPGHDQRYAIDSTKAERALGWRQSVSFEEGLQQTVQWYLDNEAWWRPLRDGVYSGDRLGLIARKV